MKEHHKRTPRHAKLEARLCSSCGPPGLPAVELSITAVGGPQDGARLVAVLPEDALQCLAHWMANVAIKHAKRGL